ncbi:hypothetical protein [Thermoflexus sp.]|uniref:hypothetical protein n=1 Tax=Thermoflexus sp. TaxID=1969742 RepID=UPI002ADD3938|nr:hypothetical protein [Thermoflexus sp.]
MGRVLISRGVFEAYPEIRRLVEEHSRMLMQIAGGESSASEIQVMSGDEILRFFRDLPPAAEGSASGRMMVVVRLTSETQSMVGEFIQALNETLTERQTGATLVLVGTQAHSAEFMQYPVMSPSEARLAIDRFLRGAEGPSSGLIGMVQRQPSGKGMRLGVGKAPAPGKESRSDHGEPEKPEGEKELPREAETGRRGIRLRMPSLRFPAPQPRVPQKTEEPASSRADGDSGAVQPPLRDRMEGSLASEIDLPVAASRPAVVPHPQPFSGWEALPVLEIIFWVLAIGGLIAAAAAIAGRWIRLPWM